jgi:hypothetical protein
MIVPVPAKRGVPRSAWVAGDATGEPWPAAFVQNIYLAGTRQR